ncbi:MAG TPA: tetratricopeptide repeat protein [Anaerolineales bacterium]|nr:tetratricopeptide repeat protein [Anaerolineales bacterium]
MPRSVLRVAAVILVIVLAVCIPVFLTGYSELGEARRAISYLEAARHYEAAAKRLPWRPDLYELAGHAYYHAKEYLYADAVYQKAFARSALSAQGWVAWGDVNYLNGNSQRAAEIWEQGLSQPDHSENLYTRLARIHEESGEYTQAAKLLQQYVSIHEEDATAQYRLGLMLTLSSPEEALSRLIIASQLDPELDPVIGTLRTALNMASLNDSPSARLVIIGRGLGLVNEWELARAAFESAVRADEENAEAWAWLGEAQQHTAGKEALTYLDRALGLNPNSPTVRGLRGLYFQRIGNDREALKEFQFAALFDPQNPAWFVSIGETYSKLGDLIRALESYQHAAALTPNDATYFRLLASFCAQNNINIRDVGIPAAQKAVQLSNDDPLALDTLGWLLTLDGRLHEAERMLLKTLEHNPQMASAHWHLALVYLEMDERAAAYDHLIRARDLGSSEASMALEQYFP